MEERSSALVNFILERLASVSEVVFLKKLEKSLTLSNLTCLRSREDILAFSNIDLAFFTSLKLVLVKSMVEACELVNM